MIQASKWTREAGSEDLSTRREGHEAVDKRCNIPGLVKRVLCEMPSFVGASQTAETKRETSSIALAEIISHMRIVGNTVQP